MNKFLTYLLLLFSILGLAGVGIASAHGWHGKFWSSSPEEIAERHQAMFEEKAELLGISIDDIKDAWAEGKTLIEIAEEHGITEEQLAKRMEDRRQEQMKESINSLVDKGIITQEQANRRIQVMEARFEDREFGEGFRGGPGHMHGMGGW